MPEDSIDREVNRNVEKYRALKEERSGRLEAESDVLILEARKQWTMFSRRSGKAVSEMRNAKSPDSEKYSF
jgi:hypothetical protein